ncbi:MAG: hypothetical protein WAX69_20700 [Victivallales bacterium]
MKIKIPVSAFTVILRRPIAILVILCIFSLITISICFMCLHKPNNTDEMTGQEAVPFKSTRVKQRDPNSNTYKLKMIALGCRLYAEKTQKNFPVDLDELVKGGYVENNEIIIWVNKEDSSRRKFIYCQGLNEKSPEDFILAAAPRPENGKREIVHVDGHAATIKEEEFQSTAQNQKWKIPSSLEPDDKNMPGKGSVFF